MLATSSKKQSGEEWHPGLKGDSTHPVMPKTCHDKHWAGAE